ncbi:MAG TPA: hypothetical protein VLE74_01265 [Candidatus Saccharimonadales bacterium]|nr:hypothetical protein [Candidatus Saccharimonadales bacterium]
MAYETRHHLFVSAEFGDLAPCERGGECKLWASGILHLADIPNPPGGIPAFETSVTLTAAGCDVCPNPRDTDKDLCEIQSYRSIVTEDRIGTATYEIEAAMEYLVQAVKKLPMVDMD